MESPQADDDICILKHETAYAAESPVAVCSGDESVASHFALVTAYEDIKKRLRDTEKENTLLRKRVKQLEDKLFRPEAPPSEGPQYMNKAFSAYRGIYMEKKDLQAELSKLKKERAESERSLTEQLQAKELELLQLRSEMETSQVMKSLNETQDYWHVNRDSSEVQIHTLQEEVQRLQLENNHLHTLYVLRQEVPESSVKNDEIQQGAPSYCRVDHLYTFFVQWSPDVYTTRRRNRSFLLVNQKKLAVNDSLLRVPDPPLWNIITVRKGKRSPSLCSSPSGSTSEDEDTEDTEETEETLPVLQQDSHILREHHVGKLAPHLPARVQCSPWQLVYSTEIHGTSLKTLYRNTTEIQQPVLLLIQDTHNQVFGAFSSDSFRVSNCCYGTGETFLFTFSPEFKMFRWSGENSYFVRGFLDSLQLGAGGGPFGLWLDSDLHRGSTFSCNTFHNAPLSSHHDFNVQALEVWSFQ